jgi:hypothetical protein
MYLKVHLYDYNIPKNHLQYFLYVTKNLHFKMKNFNLAVLFCNLRMRFSPSNSFPKQHNNNQLKARYNLNKKIALNQDLNIS